MERRRVGWQRYRRSQQLRDCPQIWHTFSFVTAVLAATGRNLLNCGSSAVASCLRYADEP